MLERLRYVLTKSQRSKDLNKFWSTSSIMTVTKTIK